jgi:hypothetical protein
VSDSSRRGGRSMEFSTRREIRVRALSEGKRVKRVALKPDPSCFPVGSESICLRSQSLHGHAVIMVGPVNERLQL